MFLYAGTLSFSSLIHNRSSCLYHSGLPAHSSGRSRWSPHLQPLGVRSRCSCGRAANEGKERKVKRGGHTVFSAAAATTAFASDFTSSIAASSSWGGHNAQLNSTHSQWRQRSPSAASAPQASTYGRYPARYPQHSVPPENQHTQQQHP